jgi:hypothetical protein
MTDGEETEVGGSGLDRRRFLRAAVGAGAGLVAGVDGTHPTSAQSDGGRQEWVFY